MTRQSAYRCFTGHTSGFGWDVRLPRILDDTLHCVAYLYRSQHEAEEGINIGGSAFLMSVPAERLPAPAGFAYAVTNAHIIKAKCNFLRLNTHGGKCVTLETKNWLVSNVDDLAVCCIPAINPAVVEARTIPRDMIITENTGMMGVVPAWKLNGLLDHSVEKERRAMAEEEEIKRRKGPKVSLDMNDRLSPAANDANPTHREDFMRLVGANPFT